MLIPPGFILVYARYTNALPHECQNQCAYSTSAPLTQSDVNEISAALAVVYKPQLNTSSVFHGVHVLEGQDGEPLSWDSATGAGNGTQTGALAPAQVQGLIRKRTSHSGRKGRGRMYIPDIQEGQVDDSGNLNSTALGHLNDIANAWVSMPVSVGVPLVGTILLHEDNSTPFAITSMAAETMVATQRRRFPRH
jgi:hypothetical protein